MTKGNNMKRVFLIDGARIPFQKSETGYIDLKASDLARMAIKGILDKSGVEPPKVGWVIMGTTISNVTHGNVAHGHAMILNNMNASGKNPLKGEARKIRKIAILGAGFMGAGIAQVTAARGIDVALKDAGTARGSNQLRYCRITRGKQDLLLTVRDFQSSVWNFTPFSLQISFTTFLPDQIAVGTPPPGSTHWPQR